MYQKGDLEREMNLNFPCNFIKNMHSNVHNIFLICIIMNNMVLRDPSVIQLIKYAEVNTGGEVNCLAKKRHTHHL